MRIISIDPGGTTGYVIWDTNVPGGIYTHGQLGPEEHHLKLDQLLAASLKGANPNDVLTIVGERFDHRNAEFAKLISNEYIGVAKRFEQANRPYVEIVWQGANQAKNFVTDEKLVKLGLMILPKIKWKDANDAMRHMVYFLTNNPKVNPDLRLELLRRLK
jgi:hypothetical protein